MKIRIEQLIDLYINTLKIYLKVTNLTYYVVVLNFNLISNSLYTNFYVILTVCK